MLEIRANSECSDRAYKILRIPFVSPSASTADTFDLFVDLRVLSILVLDRVVPWEARALGYSPVDPTAGCTASGISCRPDGGRSAGRAGRIGRPGGICPRSNLVVIRSIPGTPGIIARIKAAGGIGRPCDAVDRGASSAWRSSMRCSRHPA